MGENRWGPVPLPARARLLSPQLNASPGLRRSERRFVLPRKQFRGDLWRRAVSCRGLSPRGMMYPPKSIWIGVFMRLCKMRVAIVSVVLLMCPAATVWRSNAEAHAGPDAIPQILIDESGPEANQAAAFESACLLRDPFHVVSQYPWWAPANDQNTRVTIFVSNLAAGTATTINLLDSKGQGFTVAAESVLDAPRNSFAQVTFKLPENLAPGPCSITASTSGGNSNSASFRVAFESVHWRQDLQALATQLPLSHVNPFTKLSKSQFDQAITDLDHDIPALQDHEIVARMMQIVESIGDAHTTLTPSGSLLRFRSYPIKTYWFTDGLYITSVASSYPQALGKRLTKLGAQTSSEANASVASVISHENDAWLKAQSPS